MKLLLPLAILCLVGVAAWAQPQQSPAGKPQTCLSQYSEAASLSAGLLISMGYQIQAAIPGGLWMQKDKEVYFCNSGRAADGETLSWKLRVPVKGQSCQ